MTTDCTINFHIISSSGMILYSLSCVQYTEQETSPKEHNLHKTIILDGNWTFGDWKSKRQLQKSTQHLLRMKN